MDGGVTPEVGNGGGRYPDGGWEAVRPLLY